MNKPISEPTKALLTINAGSSSIKFALFAVPKLDAILSGQIDGIGGMARFKATFTDETPNEQFQWAESEAPRNHDAALEFLINWFGLHLAAVEIIAVGHRVVHGGTHFNAPTLIDDAVLKALETLFALAPLHEPHNLAGIRAAKHAFGKIPQVACFDTAFHRNRSFVEDCYAIPRAFYDEGVRRYGFHGLSYEFIWRQLQTDDPDAKDARIVIAHLGNGASLCAIHKGRSIASSMGFSPLDGVAMGTRCGQIDPGVLLYLMQYKNLNPQQISDLLYKDSGLKALSGGLSSDMRTLEASDRPEAKEAILYFVQRVQQEIVSLTALMQGLDILVFTGGIGENSRKIRAMVMSGLGWIGVELDAARNDAADLVLSTSGSKVRCLRICTNEEITIAGYTLSLAGNAEFEAERINASA